MKRFSFLDYICVQSRVGCYSDYGRSGPCSHSYCCWRLQFLLYNLNGEKHVLRHPDVLRIAGESVCTLSDAWSNTRLEQVTESRMGTKRWTWFLFLWNFALLIQVHAVAVVPWSKGWATVISKQSGYNVVQPPSSLYDQRQLTLANRDLSIKLHVPFNVMGARSGKKTQCLVKHQVLSSVLRHQ